MIIRLTNANGFFLGQGQYVAMVPIWFRYGPRPPILSLIVNAGIDDKSE